MKAIISIPEKEIELEFNDLTISSFNIIGVRPTKLNVMEKYVMGDKPITLITSNMPDNLKNEIEDTIRRYCNH